MAKTNPKISCLVVDDEPLATQILSDYVSKSPDLALEATCGGALQAMEILKSKPIDLIFLDIQMPDLTGLEMLDLLPQKPFIIFTTAFPEYALEGFQHNAVDYLLKPIPFAKFLKSVEKVKERMKGSALADSNASQQVSASPEVKTHIFIKTEYKIVRLDLAKLMRVEGLKDYVKFYTTDEMLLSLMSMKELEAQLPTAQFARVHKSHIVNLRHIDSIERNRIFIAGESIAIGGTYREAFFEKIGV